MLRPLNDFVVVKQLDEKTTTDGGIVIAGKIEKPLKGDVIAVGPGRWHEFGDFVETVIKPGNRVMFGKKSGEEVEIDNEKFLILRESQIVAVIEEHGS